MALAAAFMASRGFAGPGRGGTSGGAGETGGTGRYGRHRQHRYFWAGRQLRRLHHRLGVSRHRLLGQDWLRRLDERNLERRAPSSRVTTAFAVAAATLAGAILSTSGSHFSTAGERA